jgi:hypothetical protein
VGALSPGLYGFGDHGRRGSCFRYFFGIRWSPDHRWAPLPKTDATFSPDGYAPVADRVRLFYERYPMGRIMTYLVNRSEQEVVFRAEVFRLPGDRDAAATGWAAERQGDGEINTVACLENTETSAVGRALANLGFTGSRRRPSVEEIRKQTYPRASSAPTTGRPASGRTEPIVAARKVGGDALQDAADAVSDALGVLTEAERAGFDPIRACEFREALLAPDAPPSVVSRTERAVRRWFAALDAELPESVIDPIDDGPRPDGPAA